MGIGAQQQQQMQSSAPQPPQQMGGKGGGLAQMPQNSMQNQMLQQAQQESRSMQPYMPPPMQNSYAMQQPMQDQMAQLPMGQMGLFGQQPSGALPGGGLLGMSPPMQNPYAMPAEQRLASMQSQMQQLPQPAMQAGPFNPMLQTMQPVNQITGGLRDAIQQRQMQPNMNPAVQNILRRSRGLGGKGMR